MTVADDSNHKTLDAIAKSYDDAVITITNSVRILPNWLGIPILHLLSTDRSINWTRIAFPRFSAVPTGSSNSKLDILDFLRREASYFS